MGAAKKKPAPGDEAAGDHTAERHAAKPRRRVRGSRADLHEAAGRARAATDHLNVKNSRLHPAVFCQYILKDEQTGKGILLCDMHCEWQNLLSQNDRIVIWSGTELGKTNLMSVGRVLWEIGKNPSIRIAIVCAAQSLAKNIVGLIRRYIETSIEVAAVFPHLKRGRIWRQAEITVRRPGESKDPTVKAIGFGSKSVLGSRIDLVMIDDYLTAENTATEKLRNASYSWLKSTIEGRKSPNARLWFIGNSWHVRDAMHRYAKEEGMVSRKYGILDEYGNPRWPERWPMERYLKEKRSRGSVEALRSLDCEPANDNSRYFPISDLWPALLRGSTLTQLPGLRSVPPGCMTITGVDLAFGEESQHDESAIVTILVNPKGVRRLLWVEGGKWTPTQLVDKVADHHARYASIVYVETNGAQVLMKQMIHDRNLTIPVKCHVTGKNRIDPSWGIHSMAAAMAQGLWQIPNRFASKLDPSDDVLSSIGASPEVLLLLLDMVAWSPDAHTGDRLQALWIADFGANKLRGRAEVGPKPPGT